MPSERGRKEGGWWSHLSRAAKWTVATVVAAAIGVLVPVFLTTWLGLNDDEERAASTLPTQAATPTSTPTPPDPNLPPSRLVSAEKVGLYSVEVDGSAQGALEALGDPAKRKRSLNDTACTMTWDDGVEMTFAHFGGDDPCVAGRFCRAHITGRGWATTRGLQPGESAHRIAELYPKAMRVEEPGVILRYVLEPGVAPCGPDAQGGLEAWTAGGKVFALRVTFQAGGD